MEELGVLSFAFLCPQDSTQFQSIEFFAGQAEITKAMKRQGLSTAKLDFEYRSSSGGSNGNAMDICSDVGMATLWL